MNQLLTVGQHVHSKTSRMKLAVEQFLGGGGQGEVYRVNIDQQALAVKWFFPHYLRQDVRLRERLDQAIQIGPPSDRFLWPLEIVNAPGVAGFGYLMALREPRFVGMADLVTRRVEPSLHTLATLGFELAHSYLQLHSKGLCYRDISFGNVFFDPDTGEARICDNDNVDVDGQPGAIGGTARFMAPEIVRGEATPSTQTDLFSLAVLLFYLLMNHHPLEGAKEAAIRCFDRPAMIQLYGSDPVFIFDPNNTSNRPLPGQHDNALAFWPIYPAFIKRLFTRAFTEGIADPVHGRVRESEWRAAMIQLRDVLCYCPNCQAENFYDAEALRASGNSHSVGNCWACGQPVRLPPRIRLVQGSGHQVVVLRHDSKLYPHHIDHACAYDFRQPMAEIAIHPTNPSIWGLRNLTSEKWVATTANGTVHDVAPGRTVTIATGTRINFGPSEGELRL